MYPIIDSPIHGEHNGEISPNNYIGQPVARLKVYIVLRLTSMGQSASRDYPCPLNPGFTS